MPKLSKLYKALSDNQRYNFWSAATNLFLCMFTFWLGITIQFIVVDKTIDYQSKNAYIQYVEYIEPQYNNLLLTANFIGKNIIHQEMYDLLKKIGKKELSKEQLSEEQINIINNRIAVFDSNYKEIMSNVDQFIESTMLLKHVTLSDNRKQDQILEHVNKIRHGQIIIDVIKDNDIHIDSIESVMDEYFTSDEYIIEHKTFTSFVKKDRKQVRELIELVKDLRSQTEYIEGARIVGAYYIFLSSTYMNILEVCKIYENELYGGSKEVSISQWWNDVPLFYKSFLVLICTIVIGYLFCGWFLFKLSLPSNPKRDYTAEEYRSLKKERDELHNLVIVNAATMERQTTDINDLQNKVRDLEELNWEYYNEINRLRNN